MIYLSVFAPVEGKRKVPVDGGYNKSRLGERRAR
jgi:hypothetical protein